MRYRWSMSLIVALVAALLFTSTSTLAQNPIWVGDYFNNSTLSGDPVLTRNDANINFNWGTGAPADGVPADNFSVRWGTDVFLTAGTYRFTARADDKIRVIFNYQPSPLIDTFNQEAVGQTLTADVEVPADGTYHIQVDYQEITDNAYAEVSFISISGGQVGVTDVPALPPTDVNAVVTAGRLNVRDEPSVQTGQVLTVVNRNDSFPVIARNADTTWYLIRVGSIQGWVSAQFVNLNPADATVPPLEFEGAETTPSPEASGQVVTATPFTVNIRSAPTVESERLGRLPAGQSAEVIGRNADNTWWQITYNGVTGWVSAEFAIISDDVNVDELPIVEQSEQ